MLSKWDIETSRLCCAGEKVTYIGQNSWAARTN